MLQIMAQNKDRKRPLAELVGPIKKKIKWEIYTPVDVSVFKLLNTEFGNLILLKRKKAII